MMPLSPSDWQRRFSLQAEWTRQSRQYLFNLAGISTQDLPIEYLRIGPQQGFP